MSDANPAGNRVRKFPLSELVILLAFILLVSAGVVTVVIPELQDEPEAKTGGSEVAVSKDSNQVKKP